MNDPTPVADAQGTALDLDFGFHFEDLYDGQALRRLDGAFLEFVGAGDAVASRPPRRRPRRSGRARAEGVSANYWSMSHPTSTTSSQSSSASR